MVDLPANLRRVLDELPVSVLSEYLCVRLDQQQGTREMRIVFKDGRYQRGAFVIPFGALPVRPVSPGDLRA